MARCILCQVVSNMSGTDCPVNEALEELVPPGVLERAVTVATEHVPAEWLSQRSKRLFAPLLAASSDERSAAASLSNDSEGPPGLALQQQSSHPHFDDFWINEFLTEDFGINESEADRRLRATVRNELWKKFHFERYKANLLEDGVKAGFSNEALLRLLSRECPLGFEGRVQYETFCAELHQRVCHRIPNLRCSIVIGGTASKLYSENPNHFFQSFDHAGPGTSDIDVALVFEDTDAALAAMERPRTHGQFGTYQLSRYQTHSSLKLKPWSSRWQQALSREVNVVVSRNPPSHTSRVWCDAHFVSQEPSSLPSGSSHSACVPPPSQRRPLSSSAESAKAPQSVDAVEDDEGLGYLVPTSKGHKCAHYKRDTPKLYSNVNKRDVEHVQNDDAKPADYPALLLLGEFWDGWLQQRANGRFDFDDISIHDRLPWADCHPDLHAVGHWFCAPLKNPMPALPRGFDSNTWVLNKIPWQRYEKHMHSSTVYNFNSVMHDDDGLKPGKYATKSGYHGVFLYATKSHALAKKSSWYCVYSNVLDDGWFWTVRYEVAFGKFLSASLGKMSVGANQQAAREGSYHLMKIWLHALHQSELDLYGKDPRCLGASFDSFLPRYEVIPGRHQL